MVRSSRRGESPRIRPPAPTTTSLQNARCSTYLRTPSKLDPPGGSSTEISKPFRSHSDRFPVIRNRELISTSREIPASETRSPSGGD